jgi:hypothetical protein
MKANKSTKISATENRNRKQVYRGMLSTIIEADVKAALAHSERRGITHDVGRQAYFALKAEYRNYKYLSNLFLSQQALQQNRLSAELPYHIQEEFLDPDFDRSLKTQLEFSVYLIGLLINQLTPASSKEIKKDSFQIALH